MPRSRTFLPDINVWLALASRRHVHNEAAAHWFEGVGREQAFFCRITQIGLLRLLTNARVMGVDVISQSEAWKTYHRILSDSRVQFSSEPAGIDHLWQHLSRGSYPAANLWTDAYIQAFAQLRELQVVSFDKGFRRFVDPEPLILS
jgi:toxin-antitoxin system PIN domain toxin